MVAADTLSTHQPPDPMLLRAFRVTERVEETHDTVTLVLLAADGGPPMSFRPGQFNMFYIFGTGEVPLSISGDPAHPERLVHTVRAVGAVTDAIVALQPGDEVGIRGPYGSSWPVSAGSDRDLVIVAGGIGLAPVRPVIYHALSHRASYRSVSVVYGARTPQDILYPDEIHEWKARFDTNVHITVDRAAPGWLGDVGVVTPLLARL
ncbi:MAG: FAD/NAD(P)-binding protein, partial [Acidimicrobiia bacterium]